MERHPHATYSSTLFVQCAFSCACSCLLFSLIRPVCAQDTVEEVRNSYNFLEAGLSTLAAGASVALCLARGRLDSEMNVVDFFTMADFEVRNAYGSKSSASGNNGSVIGVSLGGGNYNRNVVMWFAHNTWAQGCTSTLVRFCTGGPMPHGAASVSSVSTSTSKSTRTPTPTPT
eukprot:c37199_g1_i1 orf=3-518(-)